MSNPSFSDTRVFVSQATDPDRFVSMQHHDGPTHIVVGANISDERLQRNLPSLSSRYGVTLVQLEQARDGVLGIYTPEDDTLPVEIYIGSKASTEKLSRIANRHGLDLEALIEFRDSKRNMPGTDDDLEHQLKVTG